MLESYFEEIRRKRRHTRIFWLITLLCAVGLYFFFKGYYISFNINWKNIFSETGTIFTNTGEDIASIHPFGIIHVKALPREARLTLNGNEPYRNGEKFMANHGEYTLNIDHFGYLSGNMIFSIDRDNNFYIDDIVLLKNPSYQRFPQISEAEIVSVGENAWIATTAS